MMASHNLRSMKAAQESLLRQYQEHLGTVQDLQDTLRDEVLPGVLDEVKHGEQGGVSEIELEASSREWINDTGASKPKKYSLVFIFSCISRCHLPHNSGRPVSLTVGNILSENLRTASQVHKVFCTSSHALYPPLASSLPSASYSKPNCTYSADPSRSSILGSRSPRAAHHSTQSGRACSPTRSR
jgi:hypothetical protein